MLFINKHKTSDPQHLKKKKKSSCMKRVNTINSKNSIDRKGEKYCGA